jgi:hypothetical protein
MFLDLLEKIEYKRDKESARWRWMFKDCKKPIVNHGNPEDYGLNQKEAWEMRLKYLNDKEKKFSKSVSDWTTIVMKSGKDDWVPRMYWSEMNERLKKIRRNIIFIKSLIRGEKDTRQKFDIETIKQVPINVIVEVGANNFFKIRDEKTPSCYWYKDSNRWVDFGSDEKGDVIDLVIKIHNLSFPEACKFLSNK